VHENAKSYIKDDFVIIKYENEYFPGVVLEETDEGVKVKAMAMSGNFWKWPQKDDILVYSVTDVILKIATPAQVTNRGAYRVPEIEKLRKF